MDQPEALSSEWKLLWVRAADPAFEKRVENFHLFDATMKEILRRATAFLRGMRNFVKELRTHSEAVSSYSLHANDVNVAADGSKLKQATNQITREDAPHSEIARFQRDLRHNIIVPTERHVEHNRKINMYLCNWRESLTALRFKKMTPKGQKPCGTGTVAEFEKLHSYLAEWLFVFDMHRDDIVDSTIQTMKHLQYQFFALSAHAIGNVLPARVEFRPLCEMSPEYLDGMTNDFLCRPVDEMSVITLTAQGFDEDHARRVLRICRNDTQAALDWLLHPPAEMDLVDEHGVRQPASVALVDRFKKPKPQAACNDSESDAKCKSVVVDTLHYETPPPPPLQGQKVQAAVEAISLPVAEQSPILTQRIIAANAELARRHEELRGVDGKGQGDASDSLQASLLSVQGELLNVKVERDDALAEAAKALQSVSELTAEVAKLSAKIAKLEGMESMD
mmetsp:Transcript_42960/g.98662  ORF Transcript_42960/g.98662 Transcript_42960/m.98662 type:complete len:450 (+) Transcript_42960:60-1409(+)